MGESFKWINVDKMEYLRPRDFGWGYRLYESAYTECSLLNALRELLSEDWKGDHVVFLGDYALIPSIHACTAAGNDTLLTLREQLEEPGRPVALSDLIYECYRNVSALFLEAEDEARPEIMGFLDEYVLDEDIPLFNEYGVDPDDPFKGLFQRKGKQFRYTVNHTKKICYCKDVTKVRDEEGFEMPGVDPLPLLMSYGGHSGRGAWMGDVIGVADEVDDGYTVLEQIDLVFFGG